MGHFVHVAEVDGLSEVSVVVGEVVGHLGGHLGLYILVEVVRVGLDREGDRERHGSEFGDAQRPVGVASLVDEAAQRRELVEGEGGAVLATDCDVDHPLLAVPNPGGKRLLDTGELTCQVGEVPQRHCPIEGAHRVGGVLPRPLQRFGVNAPRRRERIAHRSNPCRLVEGGDDPTRRHVARPTQPLAVGSHDVGPAGWKPGP